jgi:aldose 1-epimerase
MTHHLYFNLSAGAEPDILAHELAVAAAAFTPVGPDMIPTGERRPVAGTPFDLRRPRRIGEVVAADDPQLRLAGGGIDLNWALDPGAAEAVRLRSPASGLELRLATDQPGVQLYTAHTLKPPWPRFGALAIEPQGFPDAVNRPDFPSVVVRPGDPYRRRARYRFVAGAPGVRA